MKKFTTLMLALVVAFSLVACGKSEAAKTTDSLIAAIGEVTLSSESKIVAAENAVAVLSEKDKGQLENYVTLIAARSAYDELLAQKQEEELLAKQEEQKAKAAEISNVIAAIGEVTLDSEAAILSAETALNSADAEVLAYIENAADLTAAKERFSELQAQEVAAIIDSIGTVTIDSGDSIKAAQDAYAALSAEAAAKVSNIAALDNAVAELKNQKKQYAEGLLGSMRLAADPVRGINFYYPMEFPYYTDYWGADIRCFVLPYLGQQGDDVWLRLVANYTEDDWVFWTKITYAVDDERYYDTYKSYDMVRDNEYGDVWEYMDSEVYDSDVEMLWAIANSNQTIIRFEGDDYYYDFTVSNSDKKAIRDILTVYEALSAAK